MKVLLLCPDLSIVSAMSTLFVSGLQEPDDICRKMNHPFLNRPICQYYQWMGMHIHILESGNTGIETGFLTTRVLGMQKFHLVLQTGYCTSLDQSLKTGTLVNVINDRPGDTELISAEGKKDAYEVGWLNVMEYPHQRGAFVNMTNAYFNVFLDIRKVASVTVNSFNIGDSALSEERKKRFNVHIETTNGLQMAYACLYMKQPFYQLRLVTRGPEGEWAEMTNAASILASKTKEILEKIS